MQKRSPYTAKREPKESCGSSLKQPLWIRMLFDVFFPHAKLPSALVTQVSEMGAPACYLLFVLLCTIHSNQKRA